MKNLIALLLLLFPVTAFTQVAWTPVSYIVTLKVRNTDVTVTEKFIAYNMDLRFSPDELGTSHIKATIRVATTITSTNDSNLNKQYIDTGKYTQVALESLSLYEKGSGYAGKFNIIVKGVTREVEIPFQFTQTGNEAEFKSTFNINSRNFSEGIKAFTMNEDANVSIYIKAKS